MRKILATVALELMLVGCAGSVGSPRVTPATDDQSLVARVHTALLNDRVVHGNEISVTAQGGVVVLSGQVHGTQEADAAIAIARRVEGVKDVRSELQTNR
jgi:hyperosmotically inducible periplasmic protein